MLGILLDKHTRGVKNAEKDIEMFGDSRFLQVPCSLEEMLNTQWETDAHFTCYHIPSLEAWPRINKSALHALIEEGIPLLTSFLVFDYDLPEHAEWTTPDLEEFASKVDSFSDSPFSHLSKWSAVYTTLHGARLLYSLDEPVEVEAAERYAAWMIHEFERAGLPVDAKCKDWTRLYRCPRVLRDGKRSEEDPFFFLETSDNILPVKEIHTMPVSTVAKKRPVAAKTVDRPSTEVVEGLTKSEGKPTLLAERAKKALKGNDYYKVCLGTAVSGWAPGTYNDSIAAYYGSVLPPLVRAGLSPRECYAVTVTPILAIPESDRCYLDHSWNLLLDIHRRETTKYNDILARRAQQETDVTYTLDQMAEGMRKWCSHPDLYGDEELARDFVRHHALISFGKSFYFLQKDGHIGEVHVSKDQLISRIRKTFLDKIIATRREDKNGVQLDISPTQIQNRFSTVVCKKGMRYLGDQDGYIEDIDGDQPTLVTAMYRRNPNLVPEFDPVVDQWLQALGGIRYPELCSWISYSLAFEEGPICAISLVGEPGSGKKLFVMGLAECLQKPILASSDDLTCQSSTLTRTPFLVVNEGFPAKSRFGKDLADQFKGLTAGDPIPVNEKHEPIIYIQNPIRMIFTANHHELLRALTKGQGMSRKSRRAIGQRVLHIDASHKVNEFFEGIGNLKHTAKPGARWIAPEAGSDPSDFVVSKHFLWLYHNRDTATNNNRFLVMGNTMPAGDNDVFSSLLTGNDKAAPVCKAAITLIEADSPKIKHVEGKILITHHAIEEKLDLDGGSRLSLKDIALAVQNIMLVDDPVVLEGKEWCDLDLEVLERFAIRHGLDHGRLTSLIAKRKEQ